MTQFLFFVKRFCNLMYIFMVGTIFYLIQYCVKMFVSIKRKWFISIWWRYHNSLVNRLNRNYYTKV